MRAFIVGAACLLALTACGSTSSDSATDTATASLKAELVQQSAKHASAFTFNDAQAQCTASTVVKALGAKGLQSYGLLDTENKTTDLTLDDVRLTKADATSVVNAFIDCLGAATFTKALSDAVNTQLTTKTAEQRTCLTQKLTAAALKPMLIASLSGDDDATTKFNASLEACLPKS